MNLTPCSNLTQMETWLEVGQAPLTLKLCFLCRTWKAYRDVMEIESSLYTDFISCNRIGWRNIVHDNQKIEKKKKKKYQHRRTKGIGELAIKGAGEEPQEPGMAYSTEPGEAQPETAANSLGARCSEGHSGRSLTSKEMIPYTSTKPRACLCPGCRGTGVLIRSSNDQQP